MYVSDKDLNFFNMNKKKIIIIILASLFVKGHINMQDFFPKDVAFL